MCFARNKKCYESVEFKETEKEHLSIPDESKHLEKTWKHIIDDKNHHFNCYKMMLLTGSKNPKTLRLYEKAGYNSSDKRAFVQWLDRN